jgi:hypothetical protein
MNLFHQLESPKSRVCVETPDGPNGNPGGKRLERTLVPPNLEVDV